MSMDLVRILRWVFAILVLGNIGLLMWGTWYRESPLAQDRAPLPAVNAERMIPLTAPGVALRPRHEPAPKKPPPEPTPVQEPPAPKHCVSVGPYESEELLKQAGKRLEAAKLAHGARTEGSRIESSYWISLPKAKNRKAAERRLKELTGLGITDHYIMQEPGMENVISLGLYTQADNARNRMADLEKRGIKAQQEIRYRTRTLYWLDLDTGKPTELGASLRKLGWAEGDIQVRDQACGEEMVGPPPAPVEE